MAVPVLYQLTEAGIIKPSITEEEYKTIWRKWELKNHPDKGGSLSRYVNIKGHRTKLDDKMSMRQVRRYFNILALLESRFAEHNVPQAQGKTYLSRFADAMWASTMINTYLVSLRIFLEKRKWPAASIKSLLREIKTASDRPSKSTKSPQSSFYKSPRRISWVKPTPRTSSCRKCSSTAVSTGLRCKLPASCRMGCDVKCWRHAGKHVPRTSCRD